MAKKNTIPKRLALSAAAADAEHASLVEHLSQLRDPRVERTRLHSLQDILVLSICAIISGADDFAHIELWALSKEAWLKTFLDLENGIPSHDTIGRVFAKLDPVAFRDRFVAWTQSVTVGMKSHVAIDGKTARQSFDRASGKGAIHMVSAWSHAAQLVLGQVKTDEKSNEITAIPELLRMLDLAGCVVTIDAMGTQKNIAEQIVALKADYVLALKNNQPSTFAAVEGLFQDAAANQAPVDVLVDEPTKSAHGRKEKRTYVCMKPDPSLEAFGAWSGLRSLVMVKREAKVGDTKREEVAYFISSLLPDATTIAPYIRNHWTIENQLHWCLDVQFSEDKSRVRKDNAPENFAIMRHVAMNLLKQEKTTKVGIAGKRHKAGWDNTYLWKVLGN